MSGVSSVSAANLTEKGLEVPSEHPLSFAPRLQKPRLQKKVSHGPLNQRGHLTPNNEIRCDVPGTTSLLSKCSHWTLVPGGYLLPRYHKLMYAMTHFCHVPSTSDQTSTARRDAWTHQLHIQLMPSAVWVATQLEVASIQQLKELFSSLASFQAPLGLLAGKSFAVYLDFGKPLRSPQWRNHLPQCAGCRSQLTWWSHRAVSIPSLGWCHQKCCHSQERCVRGPVAGVYS